MNYCHSFSPYLLGDPGAWQKHCYQNVQGECPAYCLTHGQHEKQILGKCVWAKMKGELDKGIRGVIRR